MKCNLLKTDRHMNRQIDRWTDRQKDKQMDGQTHKQIDGQTDRRMDRHTENQTDRQNLLHVSSGNERCHNNKQQTCKQVYLYFAEIFCLDFSWKTSLQSLEEAHSQDCNFSVLCKTIIRKQVISLLCSILQKPDEQQHIYCGRRSFS